PRLRARLQAAQRLRAHRRQARARHAAQEPGGRRALVHRPADRHHPRRDREGALPPARAGRAAARQSGRHHAAGHRPARERAGHRRRGHRERGSRDPMRLLHLLPTLTGGGAERQLAYLTRELQRRGHELLIAYINEGWAPWVAEGLPVHKLSSQLGILGLLRSWRPDVLTTWYVESDIVGGLAAMLTRTPWIMREPNTPPLYTGRAKT